MRNTGKSTRLSEKLIGTNLRRLFLLIMALAICLAFAGCGNRGIQSEEGSSGSSESASQTNPSSDHAAEDPEMDSTEDLISQPSESPESDPTGEETNGAMKLMIGDSEVSVQWEDNESVAALRELVADGPLTVAMSGYGGFEQVGSLGTSLPRNDVQITTQAGDIVLYSGNNIVIFYGSNSWAYTRLGHIELSSSEMPELLSHGDVTVKLSVE